MNPKGKGRVPGFPEEWLSHAKSDLRLAHLAAGDELVRREQVCFHAQQAAEKAIKAVLLSREIEFPLTHDIEQLLDIVESNDVTLPENIQKSDFSPPTPSNPAIPVTGSKSRKPTLRKPSRRPNAPWHGPKKN